MDLEPASASELTPSTPFCMEIVNYAGIPRVDPESQKVMRSNPTDKACRLLTHHPIAHHDVAFRNWTFVLCAFGVVVFACLTDCTTCRKSGRGAAD